MHRGCGWAILSGSWHRLFPRADGDSLKPAVTVIVPAYNSSDTIEACLSSISGQLTEGDQLLVVDDGSTDATAPNAESLGAEVISTGGRKGPAAARNLGAEAADTPVLLFLDSDVTVPENLLEEIRGEFGGDGDVQAVQTIYTPVCPAEDPVSRYQNLYYHYALARIDPEDSAVTATWCTWTTESVARKYPVK